MEFEGGTEQVQRTRINPVVTWELTFTGSYDDLLELQDFHTARKGGVEKFYWTDGRGTQHIVRFVTDDIEITEKYGGTEDGGYGIAAFETTVTIRKVYS